MHKYGSVKKMSLKLRQDKGIKNEYLFMADVLKGKAENTSIQDAFVNHRLLIEAIK